MTEKSITGTHVLREAIRVKVATLRYAGLARDLGIAPDSLERFAENKLTFPPETLDAIAKEIFGSNNVRYDADRDVVAGRAPAGRRTTTLRSAAVEPSASDWPVA